nr:MAG TPA: hypothetical protein [Caudoviricetes sp.]
MLIILAIIAHRYKKLMPHQRLETKKKQRIEPMQIMLSG